MDIFNNSTRKIIGLLSLLFLSITIIVTSYTLLTTDFSTQNLGVDAATKDIITQDKDRFNKTSKADQKKAEDNFINTDEDLKLISGKIGKSTREIYNAIVNVPQDSDTLTKYIDEKIKTDRVKMNEMLKVEKEKKAKYLVDKNVSQSAKKENDDRIEILTRKLEVSNTLNQETISNSNGETDPNSKVLGIYGTPVTRFDPGDILTKSDYKIPGMDVYMGTGHTAVYVRSNLGSELIESFPCPESTPVPAWWDGAGWAYRNTVSCSAPLIGNVRVDGVRYYPFQGDQRWSPGSDSSYKIVSWVSTSTSAQRTNVAAVAQSLVGRRYSNPFATGWNKWSYTQICSQVAYTAWIGNGKDLSYWWHPVVTPMIVFSNSTTVARWR